MGKVETILQEAQTLAKTTLTWADLSNAIFDPLTGLVVQTFPEKEERIKFRKTKIYDELCEIVEKKMEETGVVRGATPKKSGKFVVRLPSSLHAALEREAETEGTSLNQLVLAKLAVQLDNLAGDKIQKIMQAFLEIRDKYSADKVIADPEYDRKYLRRCRELGLAGTDYELNWKLMNARKASEISGFSDIIDTRRYSVGKVIDEFEYASELAVRYMQQMRNVSLDQIICDPELSEEFDNYAAQLAPGFSPLQYRWAAFGLRKAGRLGNKVDESVKLPELENFGRITSVDLGKIPETSGLYLFSSREKPIFAGQTDNLRHRMERHIKVSSSGLPIWLWDVRREPLELGIAPLPGVTRSDRQAMEVIVVREWRPVLNFSRKVA
jgi:site-specific DNA-methyltransferase (adenine-specific)